MTIYVGTCGHHFEKPKRVWHGKTTVYCCPECYPKRVWIDHVESHCIKCGKIIKRSLESRQTKYCNDCGTEVKSNITYIFSCGHESKKCSRILVCGTETRCCPTCRNKHKDIMPIVSKRMKCTECGEMFETDPSSRQTKCDDCYYTVAHKDSMTMYHRKPFCVWYDYCMERRFDKRPNACVGCIRYEEKPIRVHVHARDSFTQTGVGRCYV